MALPRILDARAQAERNAREAKERERARSEAAMAKLEARDRAANPQEYPAQPQATQAAAAPVGGQEIEAGAAARQGAMGLARQLGGAYANVSSPNRMHPHVEDFIGEKREIMAAQPEVLDARQSAERQAAADLTSHQEMVANRAAQIRVDRDAQEFARAEQIQEVMDARKAAQTASKFATDELARAKDINPEGFWQSRTKGQKALAIIGTALAGFGGTNLIPALQTAAREHVEAAKANIGKRESIVRAREGGVRDATDLYQQTLAQVEDARAADMIMERAWMADAAAQWDRLAAQAGERALGPEQQAQRLALQESIAAMDLQIDQMAENNPKAFTRRVSTISKEERELGMFAAKEGVKLGSDLIKGGFEQGGKLEIEGAKAQAEAAQARAEGDEKLMRGEGGVYREAQKFAASTEAAQAVDALITDILSQDDIAGYGLTASPLPNAIAPEAKTVETQIRLVKESLGRLQSQGAITTDELDNFSEMVESGTTLGGESRLRTNLAELQKMIRARISPHERALSPEARAYVRRNQSLPDFTPQHTGGSSASVVEED